MSTKQRHQAPPLSCVCATPFYVPAKYQFHSLISWVSFLSWFGYRSGDPSFFQSCSRSILAQITAHSLVHKSSSPHWVFLGALERISPPIQTAPQSDCSTLNKLHLEACIVGEGGLRDFSCLHDCAPCPTERRASVVQLTSEDSASDSFCA